MWVRHARTAMWWRFQGLLVFFAVRASHFMLLILCISNFPTSNIKLLKKQVSLLQFQIKSLHLNEFSHFHNNNSNNNGMDFELWIFLCKLFFSFLFLLADNLIVFAKNVSFFFFFVVAVWHFEVEQENKIYSNIFTKISSHWREMHNALKIK